MVDASNCGPFATGFSDGYREQLGKSPVLDALPGFLNSGDDLAVDWREAEDRKDGIDGLLDGQLELRGYSGETPERAPQPANLFPVSQPLPSATHHPPLLADSTFCTVRSPSARTLSLPMLTRLLLIVCMDLHQYELQEHLQLFHPLVDLESSPVLADGPRPCLS